MDILVGNIFGGQMTGVVEVNGAPVNLRSMKRLSCYVMQNPTLLAAATVWSCSAIELGFIKAV